MPMIDVRDTSLYYESAGEGDVSVLVIHGTGAGAWSWEDQMRRLSPEFRFVAYDRRGHSRSEAGTEDQSHRTHVDDAAALIQALGLDRPVLIGTSAGGAMAIELMHRYPELVRGAVVSEPALFHLEPGAEEETRRLVGPGVQRALENNQPRETVDAFFEAVASRFWSRADHHIRDRFRDNAPMLLASLSAEKSTITPDELASIAQPVLVVTGGDSHRIMHSIAGKVVGYLPNARLIEIEGSGHVTHAEKPAEFAEIVRGFVSEIMSAASVSAHS